MQHMEGWGLEVCQDRKDLVSIVHSVHAVQLLVELWSFNLTHPYLRKFRLHEVHVYLVQVTCGALCTRTLPSPVRVACTDLDMIVHTARAAGRVHEPHGARGITQALQLECDIADAEEACSAQCTPLTASHSRPCLSRRAYSVGFWQARHKEHCSPVPQIQRPKVVLLLHSKQVVEVALLPAQAEELRRHQPHPGS